MDSTPLFYRLTQRRRQKLLLYGERFGPGTQNGFDKAVFGTYS